MRYGTILILIFCYVSFTEVAAQHEKGKKLNFNDVKVISSDGEEMQYKTLELRYSNEIDPSKNEVIKNDINFLCFRSKQKALAHYEQNKHAAQDYTVYYIYVQKQARQPPEIITYKVK